MLRVLLALACAGCYEPNVILGAPCSPSGACPEGLVCSSATSTCELRSIDAGRTDTAVTDTLVTDAAIDGANIPDAPVDAPTAPLLVQQATKSQAGGDSVSLTLPVSPIAGHVLVLIGGTPQAPLTSVSGGGAMWTRAARSTVHANIEIWVGVTNGSSGTVTMSLPGNVSQMSIALSEWANLSPLNLVSAANADAGTASPATAGPIMTTSAPSLLIFGVDVFGPNVWGLPSGGSWTPMMQISDNVAQAAWYRVEQASGTFTTDVTETGGGWDAALVALRIAP